MVKSTRNSESETGIDSSKTESWDGPTMWRPSKGERGQVLLIGGVVLAVTLLALAVVFNGAIYTNVLASEFQADASSDNSQQFQEDTREMVIDMMSGDGGADRVPGVAWGLDKQYYDENIEELSALLSQYERNSNRIVNISYNTTTKGLVAYQNSTNDFTNKNNEDWRLVNELKFRNFVVGIENTSGDDFTIEISGQNGNTVQINPEDTTTVDVHTSTGTTTCNATGTGSSLLIDITRSQINGDHCNALDFFSQMEGPYQIDIKNGDQVEGTYYVHVKGTSRSDVEGRNIEAKTYSVLVDVIYQSQQMTYESTITVAPGEPT